MARSGDGAKRSWRFLLNEGTILEVSGPEGPTEKQVRRRGRWSLIVSALMAALIVVAAAVADNVVNDVTAGGADTITAGGSTTVNYWIVVQPAAADGQAGCNAADGSSATVTINVPAGVTVDTSGSPGNQNTLVFSLCASGAVKNDQPATFTSSTPGNHSITCSVSDTGSGTYGSSSCGFTLHVLSAGDTTAPDSASVLIDDGAAWTNDSGGNVSVDISAHDAVGVSRYRLATSQAGLGSASDVAVSPAEVNFSRSDLAFTLSAGEGSGKAVWTRFCDAANNCSDASDTIGWDKTPPSITNAGVQSGTAGSNGWYISAVVNRFQASDGLSGLDASCTAAFPSGNRDVSTGASEGASVTVSSGPCSDIAGNTNAGISSASFKIDLTDPSVEITSPADQLTTIATSVTVGGTASDTPSGIDTVTVNGAGATVGSGTFSKSNVALNCGANTITALATDFAGRQTSDSITVNRLCFGLQYLQPIDQSTSSPIVNSGKYGRVIPVKVILSLLGGGALDDSALAGYGLTLQMGVNSAECSGSSTNDTVEAYADAGESAAGTNRFRWDPISQHWIYNLDTKAPAGVTMTIGSCYRLDVYVSDGTNKVRVSTSTYALFKPVK